MGPDALMIMIPSELKYLVRTAHAQEISFNEMMMYRLYQTTDKTVTPLTLAGPFIGAPHAVIAMEKLIVLGARRIWVFGWCGSLQPGIRIGHLLIPTGAVSEEGTSGHYPVGERVPESDASLDRMVEDALRQQCLPFFKGPVWTTDAVYRETPEKVKAYQARGVMGVEMEMAALMTLALYRSVKIAALLVVSDELFDLKWRPGFSNPSLRKASHVAGRILLDIAGSLHYKDDLKHKDV